MRPRLSAAVLAAAVTCAASGHAEPRKVTTMLWDITSFGLDDSVAKLIRQMLDSELSRALGPQFIKSVPGLDAATRAAVEACGFTTECLAAAAGALGIDQVIIGSAAVLGDSYSLTLKLIDARAAADLNKAKSTLTGDRAKMLGAMQLLVFELVDPSQLTGSLAVEVPLAGASVIIDGREVGVTPLASPVAGLAPGEHTLKITSPMLKDYFTFFTVHHGKTTTVRVDAEQVQSLRADIEAAEDAIRVPLYKKWWFWALAGGGAAAAAGGAVLLWGKSDETAVPETSLGTVDMRRLTGSR